MLEHQLRFATAVARREAESGNAALRQRPQDEMLAPVCSGMHNRDCSPRALAVIGVEADLHIRAILRC